MTRSVCVSVCVSRWKLDVGGGSVTVKVQEKICIAVRRNHQRSLKIVSTKTTCLGTLSIFFGCKCYHEIEIRSELLWRVHLLTFNTVLSRERLQSILSVIFNTLLKKPHATIIHICKFLTFTTVSLRNRRQM